VERTTIAGETEVLGENLPQHHFVPPQIPHDQVRFRAPDRLSYGAASLTIWFAILQKPIMYQAPKRRVYQLFLCFAII
jgi:hypothetical protein